MKFLQRFNFYLAVPSIITQQLPTTTNGLQQTVAAVTNTASVPSSSTMTIANSSVQNKTTKSPGQDRLVCSLCNKVYRSSAGLRYHKRKRHRGNEKESSKKNIYEDLVMYIQMKEC